jgi:outer membrane lipoprotein SlyB
MKKLAFFVCVAAALGGCAPDYSPDTYATRAVQQANKVEQGVVVGVRNVGVTAEGSVGAAAGAAAGGLAGSQPPGKVAGAFGTIGGALVGGLVGTAVEHTTGDTTAFEYIVRKGNGELLSVTQKDASPLALGQRVLVIAGNQARIVPDYTVPGEPASPSPAAAAPVPAAAEPAPAAQPAAATAAPNTAENPPNPPAQPQ